jgi:hypothetical protein
MMIGPGGLLLVVPHLFAVPILVLWVGLPNKKYKTILGCEKILLCRITYLAPLEMLLGNTVVSRLSTQLEPAWFVHAT